MSVCLLFSFPPHKLSFCVCFSSSLPLWIDADFQCVVVYCYMYCRRVLLHVLSSCIATCIVVVYCYMYCRRVLLHVLSSCIATCIVVVYCYMYCRRVLLHVLSSCIATCIVVVSCDYSRIIEPSFHVYMGPMYSVVSAITSSNLFRAGMEKLKPKIRGGGDGRGRVGRGGWWWGRVGTGGGGVGGFTPRFRFSFVICWFV